MTYPHSTLSFFFCVINMSALCSDQPVVPAIIPSLLHFCPFSHASLHAWKIIINIIKPHCSLSNTARNVSFPGIAIEKHLVVNIITFFSSGYSYLIISLCFPVCLVQLHYFGSTSPTSISCLRPEVTKGRNLVLGLYLLSTPYERFLSITGKS